MKTIPTDTLGGRLRKARTEFPEKITVRKMAADLGISEAQYLTYELNKVMPSDAILQLICLKYDINLHWLKDGEGEPFLRRDYPGAFVDQVLAGQNENAKIILEEACRVLDDHAWNQIADMISAVSARLQAQKEKERS